MSIIVIDEYSAGNTRPYEMNWGEGTVDITGWVIKFQMRRLDGTIFEKTATITDGPAGDFEFQWISTDLVAGHMPAELEFTTLAWKVLKKSYEHNSY